MMKKIGKITLSLLTVIFLVAASTASVEGEVKVNFLYSLSSFNGLIPYSWVGLSMDSHKNEIYVITASEVKIFSGNGMEIYSFIDDGTLGAIYHAAVDENGNIFLVSSEGITLCNFRGEPISKITLKNLPPRVLGILAKPHLHQERAPLHCRPVRQKGGGDRRKRPF